MEVFRLSHQFRKELREPVAAASSAYQTWVAPEVLLRCLMSGMVTKAYMGMARGSPCVVPSFGDTCNSSCGLTDSDGSHPRALVECDEAAR